MGWERIGWDPAARRASLRGTALDFGGIAKGYALEQAAAALRRAGAKDFLVDAGGDVLVAGSKGGRPWRVGIQHPRDPDGFLRIVEPRRVSSSPRGTTSAPIPGRARRSTTCSTRAPARRPGAARP